MSPVYNPMYACKSIYEEEFYKFLKQNERDNIHVWSNCVLNGLEIDFIIYDADETNAKIYCIEIKGHIQKTEQLTSIMDLTSSKKYKIKEFIENKIGELNQGLARKEIEKMIPFVHAVIILMGKDQADVNKDNVILWKNVGCTIEGFKTQLKSLVKYNSNERYKLEANILDQMKTRFKSDYNYFEQYSDSVNLRFIRESEVKARDRQMSELARKFLIEYLKLAKQKQGKKHCFPIEGIAGCGKTYFLEKLASIIVNKRIAFISFNVTLARKLRYDLWLNGVPINPDKDYDRFDDNNYFISTFEKFIRENYYKRNGRELRDIDDYDENWDCLRTEMNKLSPKKHEKYDYIFIDECQEMQKQDVDFVARYLTDGGLIVIAGDNKQRLISEANFDIKDMKELKGYDHIKFELPLKNYRNTRPIGMFAVLAAGIDGSARYSYENNNNDEIPEVIDDVVSLENDEVFERALYKVRRLIMHDKYYPGDIGVIFSKKKYADRFYKFCAGKNIEAIQLKYAPSGTANYFKKVEQEYHKIRFSNVKQIKGLDFPAVIYVTSKEDNANSQKMYVACSRAKNVLKVITDEPGSFKSVRDTIHGKTKGSFIL